MSNERIDLEHLEEDALMQDLNWSIARFEQVEKLVKEMTAELKRCYEKIDALTTALETIAGDLVYASSGDDVAKIADYADEMSSLY